MRENLKDIFVLPLCVVPVVVIGSVTSCPQINSSPVFIKVSDQPLPKF